MDNYTRYKVLHGEVLLDLALGFRWKPEKEKEVKDLDDLWNSLTDAERADLREWLEQQERL